MSSTRRGERSRKQIVLIVSLAMLAEAVFLLWPMVSIYSREGFLSDAAITGVIISLFAGYAIGLMYGLGGGLVIGLVFSLSVGFVGNLFFCASFGLVEDVGSCLASGLTVGIVGGVITVLAGGFAGSLISSFGYGVPTGIVGGLVIGFAYGRGLGLAGGLIIGFCFVLMSGLAHSVWSSITIGFCGGITGGIVASFAFGPFNGLTLGLGICTGVPIGVSSVHVLKQLSEGATDAITSFFAPWKSKEFNFWKAIGFFVLVYIGFILLFSMWFYAFHLESIKGVPTSRPFFDIREAIGTQIWWDFVYFSFVTITTTGYGDITPMHWLPQVFVFLETLMGIGLVVGFLGMILKVAGERRRDVKTENEEIVKRFLLGLPATSDDRIAEVLGCDPKEVSRIRQELRGSGKLPKADSDSTQGK